MKGEYEVLIMVQAYVSSKLCQREQIIDTYTINNEVEREQRQKNIFFFFFFHILQVTNQFGATSTNVQFSNQTFVVTVMFLYVSSNYV